MPAPTCSASAMCWSRTPRNSRCWKPGRTANPYRHPGRGRRAGPLEPLLRGRGGDRGGRLPSAQRHGEGAQHPGTAGRRRRAHSLQRRALPGLLETRPGAGRRQHRDPQAAARPGLLGASGRTGPGGGVPARGDRRCHRRRRRGPPAWGARRRADEAVRLRGGRQVRAHRLRRRRPRRSHCRGPAGRLLRSRSDLCRGLPDPRPERGVRGVTPQVRGSGRAAAGRRPPRSAHPRRAGGLGRGSGTDRGVCGRRPREGGASRHRRKAGHRRRSGRGGLLVRADRAGRRHARPRGLPGGGLRPGRHGAPLRHGGRGGRAGQLRRVRPGRWLPDPAMRRVRTGWRDGWRRAWSG